MKRARENAERGFMSSRTPLRSFVLVLGLALAVIVACGPSQDHDDEHTDSTKEPLRTNPTLGDFAVYASNSVSLMDRASVQGGDVGVEHSSNGPFLVAGYEASLVADAKIDATHDLLAEDVYLRDRATVGDVEATHITNQNGGVYVHQYALPPMPASPAVATPAPGTTALNVSSGQTTTIAGGSYAAVTVNGTLNLSGGTYEFASLTLGNDAKLQATGTSQVHIAGRISTGDRARIQTSGTSLSAKDLRVEVSGQNGSTGAITATPKAVAFGNDTVVRALFIAPNGTLQLGQRTQATGALFGRDILVNLDAKVTFEDGIASQGCSSSCDDQNPCTTDQCSSGSCTHTAAANGTGCDDHDSCTRTDTCQNGACVGGNPIVCPAPDLCHFAGACNATTGTCSTPAKPDGTSCSTNACSPSDHCQSGTCVTGAPVSCSAADVCHLAGSCNATTGTCSTPSAPAGTSCSDGNACNGLELCNGAGTCVPGSSPPIDDGNPCTIDACDPVLGVVHMLAPSGTSCANDTLCDGNETCDGSGSCVAGAPPTVDDNNPCTDDACTPSEGVTHTPRQAGDEACSDHDACNGAEACDGAGTCVAGTAPLLDDGNICTIDECSPLSGPFHTPVSGCDPTPTISDERFETRASILGQLVDRSGAPVTSATFTVYDERRSGLPRSDVLARVGSDGTFRLRLTTFPDAEPDRSPPHRLVIVVEAPGLLPAQRVIYAHPGDAVPLGSIRLIARDPQVTNIGPAGGVASDSRNRVQVVIPAGALTTTIPVQITPFDEREDFPAPLPSSTLTTYGMELEPSGTVFAQPVTVRVANTLGLPTTLRIPVGVYNTTESQWDTLSEATWDGARFSFAAPHFSTFDANMAQLLDLVARITRGHNGNKGEDKGCTGSSWSTEGGSMLDRFPLPSIHAGGEDFTFGLHYNSGLAGSRKTGVAPSQTTASSNTAVPLSSLGVGVAGTKVSFSCVAKGSGAGGGGGANTPNSCSSSQVVGTCGAGGSVGSPRLDIGMIAALNSIGLNPPDNATELTDGSTWALVPYATDLTFPTATTPLARTDFFAQNFQLSFRGSSTCGGAGGGAESTAGPPTTTFGASDPTSTRVTLPLKQGPLANMTRRVLVHHRFSSPYGAGWAIDAASRIYVDGDHAVLVGGDGHEEEFHPRASVASLASAGPIPDVAAFARDPQTGESFAYFPQNGTIEKIDPASGARTVAVSNAGTSTSAHGLAVAYVSGTQRFVYANRSGISDIVPGQSPRVLLAKSTPSSTWRKLSIAARGASAFYTVGDGDPDRAILFKLDLTASHPSPEALTPPIPPGAGPDPGWSMNPPRFLGVAEVHFSGPKGLAFGEDGSLYLSDSGRHAVYRIVPDANGVISNVSKVELAVGNGSGTAALPIGERFPGDSFVLNQPHQLAMSEDGYLFIANSLGVAVYDTHAKEAEMLFFDGGADEIVPVITDQTPLTSFLPTTKRNLLATSDRGVVRIAVDLLSSDKDPTRVLVRDPSGAATLTDTSTAIVDRFDTHGRLVEHRRRTGKLLYGIQYIDADNDRIDRITNAAGGAYVFGYAGSKLSLITDPSGATSTFTVDEQGDLTGILDPDGERHRFAYDSHRVVTKTSPRGDETKYTYAADGTLATTQKPNGEVHELHASISAAQSYNPDGTLAVGGSFTDPRGVVHTFFQSDDGDIEKEIYVADGVTYTRQAVLPTFLYSTFNDDFINRRLNRNLRRVSQWKVNDYGVAPPIVFDSKGRPASQGVTGSQTQNWTMWRYDTEGWLSAVAYPGATATREFIERDAAGRITRIFDASRGDLGSSAPTGRQTTFTWRSDDQPATVTKHGVTTTFTYDDAGSKNLTGTSDTVGRTMTYGHDARGNVTSTTDGTASAAFEFDGNNRLLRSLDGEGNITTFEYTHSSCGCSEQDLVTGIVTPDLPFGVKWSFEYGPEGRLTKVIDPNNFAESMTYTPTGELASITDRLNRTSTMTYDQLGRITALLDVANRKHTRTYPTPTAGVLAGPALTTGSTDASAASTSLTTAPRNGDYQIGLNAFDVEGFPAQISLYRDATFELAYRQRFDSAYRLDQRRDRANRPIASIDVTSSNDDGTFDDHLITYEPETSAPVVRYDSSRGASYNESSFSTHNVELDTTTATGFGTGLEAPSSHIFTRDVAGRVTNATNRFYFATAPVSPAVRNGPDSHYTYRLDGRLGEVRNGNEAHSFTYDARGLVRTRVVDVEGTYTYGYDEVGRNTSLTYPDGHVRTQTFDDLGRITERCYTYPGNSAIADRCYGASYDPVGNIVELRDPEGRDAIAVDALDRLTSITRTGPPADPPIVETYEYNAIGALKTNAGVSLATQRPRLDGAGNADAAVPAALGGQPVVLNKGGFVTNVRGTDFNFSRAGTFLGADGATFAVNTDHLRAWSSRGGVNEAYVYEGANIVATIVHVVDPITHEERDEVRDRWVYDGVDHPLRARTIRQPVVPNVDLYLELDLAGNVRRVRGAHGEDYGGYRYTAFGQTVEDTATSQLAALNLENRLRWKGRPRQVFGGTEVYDMRARQWAPELGTFLSVDEYAFHDARSTLWGWPGQNPLRYADPSGHDAYGTAIGAGIGGLLGARAGFVIGGGAGLAGLAGGPAVVVTVPAGAYAGAGAGLAAGGLIGAYWGNRIGDKIIGLFNTGGDDEDGPPSSGVRPIPKPDAPAVPQEDVSGVTTRAQRCSEEATRVTDEMERNGCTSDTELNKAWSEAFAACMQALGESL